MTIDSQSPDPIPQAVDVQSVCAEIERLLAAATPEPWAWGTDEHDYRLRSERTGVIVATVENAADAMMLSAAPGLLRQAAALLRSSEAEVEGVRQERDEGWAIQREIFERFDSMRGLIARADEHRRTEYESPAKFNLAAQNIVTDLAFLVLDRSAVLSAAPPRAVAGDAVGETVEAEVYGAYTQLGSRDSASISNKFLILPSSWRIGQRVRVIAINADEPGVAE